MNVDVDLEQADEARLTDLLRRAERELSLRGYSTLARPGLRLFDDRLDAGRALPPSPAHPEGMIELNAVYLQQAREAMLEETVAHELAHLLVFHLSPRRRQPPHGKLWRDIMQQWFGVKPERTHRFPTAGVRSRRQRRWAYRCACSAHELSTVRHHRVQRGTVYLCRRCHEALQPEGMP